jgi:hypothetical protein
MKRAWVFIGVILLLAGIVFEEKHRAETIKNHLPPMAMRDPAAAPYVVKDNNFSDYADLWGDPWEKADGPVVSYSSLALGNDHHAASFEKFQSRLEGKTDQLLTVQNRQLDYTLLDLGSFKLNVNLKPGYTTPEALLPTRIDPGISGGFSF